MKKKNKEVSTAKTPRFFPPLMIGEGLITVVNKYVEGGGKKTLKIVRGPGPPPPGREERGILRKGAVK